MSACQLTPLHGGDRGRELDRQLASVDINTPQNRLGFFLHNQLSKELNPAGLDVLPEMELDIELRSTNEALAIQLDSSITRIDLALAAFASLRFVESQDVIYRTAVHRVATYNVEGQLYATKVAQQDAQRRALKEIAQELRSLISIRLLRDGV